MSEPLVSIVTPCLNASRFLEKTIQSVLSQDYPRLEYIVMDGGSSDRTLEILQKYGARLKYISAPDAGVADAVNRGFLQSHGSIFAWLSADDLYFPGAIRKAVERLRADPGAGVVYGGAAWVDEHQAVLGRYPTMAPFRAEFLEQECVICQPACFLRRETFEQAGLLNSRLKFSFDYDLWIRLSRFTRFAAMDDLLAMSRMHRSNITLRQRREVFEETIGLFRQHYGYIPLPWIYCYLSFLRDGRDQFFEPLQPSKAVFWSSLWTGSYYNRRRLGRYWREWFSNFSSGERGRPAPALPAGLVPAR
jgi:glycosyltransferase involved in cell wall biosynthesis